MHHKTWKNAAIASVGCLAIAILLVPQVVDADRYDQQINTLNQQNNAARAQNQQLEVEAGNLQAVIDGIRSEIAAIESQIQANQTKRSDTVQKIAEGEARLTELKETLGENLQQMYIDGGMSTIEMLATSQNLSHFVDKQEYGQSVQAKIQKTLEDINKLQAKLRADKASLDALIADQEAMQGQLAAQRSEQDRLLAMNQEQQGQYEQSIESNNVQIANLRKQQAAVNARFTSGSTTRKNIPDTTGYPWANAPFPNTIIDSWGMYQRQCVSYTAWKVWKSGRHMPYWGGRGNAKLWDDNARSAGIPVDGSPRVGDVAISNRGHYGHAMYVEAVYDDGTILVSQYNASWDGRYSEARIAKGDLAFIHF